MPDSQSPPNWSVEDSRLLHEFEMFSVRRERARNPEDGSVEAFHIAESPDGVIVLALTGDDEMILVEQYRHGVRRLTLELPAGIVDEGEDPVAAGLRELREETGYEAARGEVIGEISLNPSWQAMRVHVVLVRDTGPQKAKDLDAGEDTRVRKLALPRVHDLVRRGDIKSGVTLSALMFFALAG